MSIPKSGKFHNCNAYVTHLYANNEHTIRLVSYQSTVVDYNEDTRTITLYPRWEYSVTTIRQVCRFIQECTGVYYDTKDLRMFKRIQEKDNKQVCHYTRGSNRNLLGHMFIFSNEFPRG